MGNTTSKDNQVKVNHNPVEFQTYIMVVQAKINLNRNKKVELIRKKRKEVTESLLDNSLDIAKAKMDSIIREEDLITVYDIIGPICEILKEKVTYMMLADKCPDDLRAPLDTIIYASARLEIDELHRIRELIRRKYGEVYIAKANSNADSLVNINVIEKLKIRQTADPYLIARLKQICREQGIKVDFPQDVIPIVTTPENFNNYGNQYSSLGKRIPEINQPLNSNMYPGFHCGNRNYNQFDENVQNGFPGNFQNNMNYQPIDNFQNMNVSNTNNNMGMTPHPNNFGANNPNIPVNSSVNNFQDFNNRNINLNNVPSGFGYSEDPNYNYKSPSIQSGDNRNYSGNINNPDIVKNQDEKSMNVNSQNFSSKGIQMPSGFGYSEDPNYNYKSPSIQSGDNRNNIGNINNPDVAKNQEEKSMNVNYQNFPSKGVQMPSGFSYGNDPNYNYKLPSIQSGNMNINSLNNNFPQIDKSLSEKSMNINSQNFPKKDLQINSQDANTDLPSSRFNELNFKSEMKDVTKNNMTQNKNVQPPTMHDLNDDLKNQIFNNTFPKIDNRNNQTPDMNFPTRSVVMMGPKLNEDNAIFPKTQNEKNDEFGSVYIDSNLKSSKNKSSNSNNYNNDFDININQLPLESQGEFNLIKDSKPYQNQQQVTPDNEKKETISGSNITKTLDSTIKPDQNQLQILQDNEKKEINSEGTIKKETHSDSLNSKLRESASGKIYSNVKNSTPRPLNENDSIHLFTKPELSTTVDLGKEETENRFEGTLNKTQFLGNNLNNTHASEKIKDNQKVEVHKPGSDEFNVENLFPNPLKSLSSEFPTAKSDHY